MHPKRWLHTIPLRLRSIFRRTQVERDLDDELQYHLEMKIEENVAKGMSNEEARYAALREMGGMEQHKEECRDAWCVRWMNEFLQDLRYGFRILAKSPGFTFMAILVLAIGIGTNTAMFTLINNMFLRASPFKNPDEIVSLFNKNTKMPGSYRAFSYADYTDIREQNTVFTDLMAYRRGEMAVREGDTTRRISSEIVSANYFKTFGASLWKGRVFTPEEEKPGAAIPVVIVSYEYWQSTGEDPDLIGKSIWINGHSCTVIGIAREGFTGRMPINPSSVWLPLGMHELVIKNDIVDRIKEPLALRSNHCLFLVGRLKPGVSSTQADSQLAFLASQFAKAYPEENGEYSIITDKLSLFSIGTGPPDDSDITRLSIFLLSMAGLVLLIACFNLANMMLVRGTSRKKEFAMRLALGCSRGRIVRQLFTEGFILSVLGAVAGLFLAIWSASLLKTISDSDISLNTLPDIRVFGAMLTFCLLSTIIFSLGPAWKAVKPDLAIALKECTGEDVASMQKRRLFSPRNVLVVGQLALSMTLLIAAGLFLRSALKAANVDPGFSIDNVALAEIDAGPAGYDEVRGRALYRSIQEKLAALPGVESVSAAALAPYGTTTIRPLVIKAEDAQRVLDENGMPKRGVAVGLQRGGDETSGKMIGSPARFNSVGADYFKTLGVRMLSGRPFSAEEEIPGTKAPVAIIDTNLAKQLWQGEDPLGKHIVLAGMKEIAEEMEVIGIVPSLLDSFSEDKNWPHVYVPFGQPYQSNFHFFIRISQPNREAIAAILPQVRRAIQSEDNQLLILSLRGMRTQIDNNSTLWEFKIAARMFSVLGALALFLAIVGVYGLNSYTVARRTREIGIRMALGASFRNTLWLILKEGIWLTSSGAALGLALSLLVGQLLGATLYEVSPRDAVVFMSVPLLLSAVSMLASYIPARRAARVDPASALRYE